MMMVGTDSDKFTKTLLLKISLTLTGKLLMIYNFFPSKEILELVVEEIETNMAINKGITF